MIIVEKVLDAVFEYLPEMDNFKPIYDWGDEVALNNLMKLYASQGVSIYPLIYQTSKGSEQYYGEEATIDLVLVLAMLNTEVSLTNRQRWAMSYEKILYPLVNNIESCFVQSGLFTWDGNFTITEYPNYGNDNDNISTDIWDAIEFKTKIKINNGNLNCINTINF